VQRILIRTIITNSQASLGASLGASFVRFGIEALGNSLKELNAARAAQSERGRP
jgi:hypothetical protein